MTGRTVSILAVVASVPLALLAQPYSDLAVINITVPDTLEPRGSLTPTVTVANIGPASDTASVYFWVERPGGGFNQSFTVDTFPPTGWQEFHPDGGAFNWLRGTSYPYSPPGYATCLREASLIENDDWLVTPKVRVRASDTIYFWFRALGPQWESLRVWVSYTDSAPASFQRAIQAFDFNNNGYQLGWADFHSVGDTLVYIGIQYRMRPTQAGTGVCLDDIQLRTVYYLDSVRVHVPAGESRVLMFADWNAPVGQYLARCAVAAPADTNPVNDELTKPFRTYEPPPPPPLWVEQTPMPFAPSGKPIKRGGWLTVRGGRIYAAKGNKTTDFYSYEPETNVWTLLEAMPYASHPLWFKKPPDKGSKGTFGGGGYIYVTQGNNSLGFWRYHIGGDSWGMLPDVPAGPSGKKVKGGTDIVSFRRGGVRWVYLLKGYRCEFYRYHTDEFRWEQLPDAPVGARPKWDKGSWIVYDGSGKIYAHKAKYHELYAFDVDSLKWSTAPLAPMPYIGMMVRRKKMKDGGSAVLEGGRIYALKGGNTQEVWVYDIGGNVWDELDTIPSYGVTGRRKKVKHGGDLVLAEPGGIPTLYAVKGNKTVELWAYPLGGTAGDGPTGTAVRSTRADRDPQAFEISPNPVDGNWLRISYSLPVAGPATVALHDVAGRKVREYRFNAEQAGCHVFSRTGLAPGVYLVRLTTSAGTIERKLIVQR